MTCQNLQNENGEQGDGSPPDPKRVRRNSQQLGDGVSPGQPGMMPNGTSRGQTPYSSENNGQHGAMQQVSLLELHNLQSIHINAYQTISQQFFQLPQGIRRPQTFNPGHPLSGSPQLGALQPPLNVLSEHAPAQMAATVAPIKGTNPVRPGGIPSAPQAQQPNGGSFVPPLARFQQATMNPSTRNGPPSPPPGNSTQKGSMPPPSHALAPSPLGKDQGKGNSGTQVCLFSFTESTIFMIDVMVAHSLFRPQPEIQ